MTAQTVSKAANRYANAFFELLSDGSSLEEGSGSGGLSQSSTVSSKSESLEEARAELQLLVNCIESNSDLEKSLQSPVCTRDQKSMIFADISSTLNFSKMLSNFLGVIALNGRASDIVAIHRAFEQIYAKKQGLSQVTITTAEPMNNEQRENICNVVKKKTGNDFVLTERVDPDLIGGIQMQIGSTLYDASIATKLDRLHNSMKGV